MWFQSIQAHANQVQPALGLWLKHVQMKVCMYVLGFLLWVCMTWRGQPHDLVKIIFRLDAELLIRNVSFVASGAFQMGLVYLAYYLYSSVLKLMGHSLGAWRVSTRPYLLKHTSTCWFPLCPQESERAWDCQGIQFKHVFSPWYPWMFIFFTEHKVISVFSIVVSFNEDNGWAKNLMMSDVYNFDLLGKLVTHCLLLYEWGVSCLL